MLLQHILLQLDGELVRLQNLRKVVASLAKAPAIVRHLAPQIDKLREAEMKAASRTQAESSPVARAEAKIAAKGEGETAPEQPRRRGRPRKDPALPVVRRAHSPRGSRQTEPTALTRSAQAGPVVVSAAALARERESRANAKAGTHDKEADQPEVLPDTFARALAARWLPSASKA